MPGRSGHDRVRRGPPVSCPPSSSPCHERQLCATCLTAAMSNSSLTFSLTRTPPLSSATFQARSQSRRLTVARPSKPARKLPHGSLEVPVSSNCTATGLVLPLMVRSPISVYTSSSTLSTLVLTNEIVGYFSRSKKSGVLRWASRSALPVSTLAASISTLAQLFSGFSSSRWTSPL